MTSEDEVRSIFVYGTLKRGQINDHLLASYALTIREATIDGLLYDVGEFPALIDGHGKVHGEVVAVEPALLSHVLAVLDRLEDFVQNEPESSMYLRRVVHAETASQSVNAYAYFFNIAHPALPPINRLQYLSEGTWPGPTAGTARFGSREFEDYRDHVRGFHEIGRESDDNCGCK